jgi:YHS domain-containing protein
MNPHVLRPNRVASRLALAIGALCLVIPQQFTRADDPAAIDWRDDYAGAMEEARAANRLLWIQFTGPWCPNCTRMERDSLPDPAIVERAQQSFVAVKLRSDLSAELIAAFNLTAIPATVIVAPNRDVISVHQGYMGPQELDGVLREGQARLELKPAQEPPRAGSEKATAAASDKTADEPLAEAAIAVSGYCAVSLVEERKLVKGRSEHAVVHEGRAYHFTSPAASERFRQQPARFIPWSGGTCPVTQLEQGLAKPGNPRWGVLYAGRLFLCASDQDRRRFVANPGRFADQQIARAGSADSDSPSHKGVNR